MIIRLLAAAALSTLSLATAAQDAPSLISDRFMSSACWQRRRLRPWVRHRSALTAWRKDIQPLVKEQCGACHGASSPSYEDWNLDRKNFEAKKVGPRMENYTDFMRHVVWPATGSMARRLDDGKNAEARPATCMRSSAATAATCVPRRRDATRAKNLATIGQLGNGDSAPSVTPVDVTGLASGVVALSAGPEHSCALMTSGGLKCWGANHSGQLGIGSTGHASTPRDVVGLTSGVARVAAGGTIESDLLWGSFTCALTTAGGVKCWGNNETGQLGSPISSPALTPVDVTGLASGATAITAGGAHACAIVAGGSAKCWGSNLYLQLGRPGSGGALPEVVAGLPPGAIAIAAGGLHTCALTAAGVTQCWGAGPQLGRPAAGPSSAPAAVVALTSAMQAIAAGSGHSCALGPTGGVKCWGDNTQGQLGNNGAARFPTPVGVLATTACAGFDDVDANSPFCANVAWMVNRGRHAWLRRRSVLPRCHRDADRDGCLRQSPGYRLVADRGLDAGIPWRDQSEPGHPRLHNHRRCQQPDAPRSARRHCRRDRNQRHALHGGTGTPRTRRLPGVPSRCAFARGGACRSLDSDSNVRAFRRCRRTCDRIRDSDRSAGPPGERRVEPSHMQFAIADREPQ